MNNPTPETVAAALALVDAVTLDEVAAATIRVHDIRPPERGDSAYGYAARILAAEVRRLRERIASIDAATDFKTMRRRAALP